MNNWVNLNALWRIVVVGVLAGAGLPAIFALGVRALASGSHPAVEGMDRTDSEQAMGASRTGIALASFCFAVVLAAIGYGIYLIVKAG
jgi:hypothetical protein